MLRVLEESHEEGPIQQSNKITEVTNAGNTFFYSPLCDLCPHWFRRLLINSTNKLSSWKATSSLAGQGNPGILYEPICHYRETACLLISAYFPATIMHLLHFGACLKIPSRYKLGLLQSWTALCKLAIDKTNAVDKSQNVTRSPPHPQKKITLLPRSIPSSMCCADSCGHCNGRPFDPFRVLCIICCRSALSLSHHHTAPSTGTEFHPKGGELCP